MKVKQLIEELKKYDPEAQVHYPDDDRNFNGSVEINEVYESTATYGIATKNPTTVKTVVLATGTEGM